MRIAVISDIHDRLANLEGVLKALAAHPPAVLICCGDITRPETLEVLAESGVPVHFCLGNCDQAAADDLLKMARKRKTLHATARTLGKLQVSGFSLAFTHFPETALAAAGSGTYKA